MNCRQLAETIHADGRQLADLKSSPYFGTFKWELAALSASLRLLADITSRVAQACPSRLCQRTLSRGSDRLCLCLEAPS